MRKPKLNDRFGFKKGLGIVNILLGEQSPDQITVKVMNDYPLYLYPTGPIPPNPSELLESDNMEKFKNHLNRNYDVVIIDTPPYALVADAQILAKWSDVNMFVVRFGKTLREQIHEMEEVRARNQFKNMVILLNGISMSGYYGYKYGYYGKKRKYGYNYYERE